MFCVHSDLTNHARPMPSHKENYHPFTDNIRCIASMHTTIHKVVILSQKMKDSIPAVLIFPIILVNMDAHGAQDGAVCMFK